MSEQASPDAMPEPTGQDPRLLEVRLVLRPGPNGTVVMGFLHSLDDAQRYLITEAHLGGILGHRAPYAPSAP